MPNQISTEKYSVKLSGKPKGVYWLAIQIFDTISDKPVEIGLSTNIKVDDYFKVQNLSF